MDLLNPHFGLFAWTLVVFLIILFLLKKFAWKPILKALNERETGIAESIATAERVRSEMAQLQAKNEQLLAEAKEERSQMLREASEARDRIIHEAKERAKVEETKIIEEAKLQIERLKNAAMTEVKNEIGNLAVEVAERILRKELTSTEAQKEYVKKLTSEIKLN